MSADAEVLFGIAGPQIHARTPVKSEEVLSYIQRAEALNYHSLWCQEQMGLKPAYAGLETIALLSYAAALTRHIRLGMAVFLIALRNPVQLAKSLATLDQLSEGRVIVGVGLGADRRVYPAYGLSAERRVARFTEALTVMKRLWSEDGVSFEGSFLQLSNATLVPKPVQQPHPPIWFGASSPPALKRAVRLGSGFLGAGSSSTADFKSFVQIVRQGLDEAKRDPASFMIGKRVYLAVDSDRVRALKRLREWFGGYYGRAEAADRVAVYGSREEILEKLNEILSGGARLLLLNPVFDMGDHLELLAAEIIPKIRS